MKIGIPKEIKVREYRVGMIPGSVREAVRYGHKVLVEAGAGLGIGFTDNDYKAVGATIVATSEEIFAAAELIVKVKEPQPDECKMLSSDQAIFTFLHLAADSLQTELLQKSGCTAIAYETVTNGNVGLPLLAPMSEVAGKISVQLGAHYLEKAQGGRGILLGGVPGVAAGNVLIIGGGVVGSSAIRIALGMGAKVTVLDKSLPRLRQLQKIFGSALNVIAANEDNLAKLIPDTDLLIGAVLVPGAEAPKVVSKEMIAKLPPGAVAVDVAIDQGGCFESSTPTNFDDPIYVEDGVIHCCVTNLPGSVPRTSALALNNATLPFVLELANKGYKSALLDDPYLLSGLNVCSGKITHKAVAELFAKDYSSPAEVLKAL